MRIIIDVHPDQIDWSDDSRATVHRRVEEAWGAPLTWEEVDFTVKGKFYGEPIEIYDDGAGEDEWEAIKYLMACGR